jgi:thiol-disulfide isomerase/thioredoxin
MTRRHWTVLAAATIGLLALVAGVTWRTVSDDTGGSSARQDGTSLLALTLPDASGREQPLKQWKGKVVVVNFWATWCEPCREEMPRFVKLQDEYGDKGLQFVGIAIDDADKVQRFASEIHLNYPTLMGGYGAIELSKSTGNRYGALPFTVVIDRAGAIVHAQLGPIRDTQLLAMMRQLL